MTDAPIITFLDNPHAPDIFATEATGFFAANGNVMITLESARPDYSRGSANVNRVVIARLVLPVSGAQNLALGLHEFLSQNGLDPTVAARGGAATQ